MLSYKQFHIIMVIVFAASVRYIMSSFRRTNISDDGENMVTPASAIRSFDNPHR